MRSTCGRLIRAGQPSRNCVIDCPPPRDAGYGSQSHADSSSEPMGGAEAIEADWALMKAPPEGPAMFFSDGSTLLRSMKDESLRATWAPSLIDPSPARYSCVRSASMWFSERKTPKSWWSPVGLTPSTDVFWRPVAVTVSVAVVVLCEGKAP